MKLSYILSTLFIVHSGAYILAQPAQLPYGKTSPGYSKWHEEFYKSIAGGEEFMQMQKEENKRQFLLERGLPLDFVVPDELRPPDNVIRILNENNVDVTFRNINGVINTCVIINGGFDEVFPVLNKVPRLAELTIDTYSNDIKVLTDIHLSYLSDIYSIYQLCLDLKNESLSDSALTPLIQMPKLRKIEINNCSDLNSHFNVISKCVSLEELVINDCNSKAPIDNSEFKKLKTLVNLSKLEIHAGPVGLGSGIQAVGTMNKLRTLSAQDCNISDSDTIGIDRLIHLNTLSLSGNNIGDNTLSRISKCTNLKSLYICENDLMTSDGLLQLRTLDKLESLAVDCDKVNDSVLKMICSFKKLWHLEIRGGDLPPHYVKEIRKIIPDFYDWKDEIVDESE